MVLRGPPRPLLRLAAEDAWTRGAVVVAAHPDDETIGCGGVMARLPLLAVVHVTDGAPADPRWWGAPEFPSRDAYAAARRREAERALRLARVEAARIRALGYGDQRASLALDELARELAALLDELRPGVVVTHAYEGGHPDHDAAALAVRCACRLAAGPAPRVLEFTGYHAQGMGIGTGRFLPAPGAEEAAVPLDPASRARKRRMLACFGTQHATLAQFAVGSREHFRAAPDYDFTRAPHAGTLHYERFAWGITGPEWRVRAAAALRTLEGGGAPCGRCRTSPGPSPP